MAELDFDGREWDVPDVPAALVQSLSQAIGAGLLTPTVLVSRGLCGPAEARRFLECPVSDLQDPFLLPDMQPAVARLREALESGEQIFVHGDYDADGICAAALLIRCLSSLGANVCYHLPHRIEEGYGLSSESIRRAARQGARLMLTVDCGATAFDEVALARDLGMDVIVTDHHLTRSELPPALAVIDPMRKDCTHPSKELAGVGVAFKLGEALCRELEIPAEHYIRAFADLAAIGTVADVVPLVGENRVLVRQGLALLAETKKAGLKALAQVAELTGRTITARDVAFRIGPRLNAAGRIADATQALELLLTSDEAAALQLALHLDSINRKRRQLDESILAQALAKLEQDADLASAPVIVLHDDSWHVGVIGIVASKLLEAFHRPVVLFGAADGELRGSARSIPGFHIAEALEECSDMLLRCGGHDLAAGLAIMPDQVEAFRKRINDIGYRELGAFPLAPTVHADAVMPLEALRVEDVERLAALEPFGEGNPEPMFVATDVAVSMAKRVGADGRHLRMVLTRGGHTVDAIAFNGGRWLEALEQAQRIDACYTPFVETWNGTRSLRLRVEAVRRSLRG